MGLWDLLLLIINGKYACISSVVYEAYLCMQSYINTHIHTCTYIRMYIHAYMHSYVYAYIHTIHTYNTHTSMHTYIVYVRMYIRTSVYTHIRYILLYELIFVCRCWDKPVSELKLQPFKVSIATSCSQAISYMKENSLLQVTVVSDKG